MPELRHVTSIGQLDGPEALTLGEIRDLEVDEQGDVYVLDDVIRRFGPGGEPSGRIESRGEGPGEIQDPLDIELDAEGAVHVLDPRNARLSIFDTGVEGFIYRGSVTLPTSIWEFCELKSARYAARPVEGALLHRIGPEGEFAESFGSVLPVPGEEALDQSFRGLARFQSNAGPILCLEDRGLVVLAAGSLPYVRAFDTAGTERWRDTLDDYRPTHWSQDGPSLEAGPGDKDGRHYARSFVRWSDDVVLVQLEHRFPEREHPDRQFYELESRFISLSDGREVARSDSLPWIRAVAGETVYAVRNIPYPRVEIYER